MKPFLFLITFVSLIIWGIYLIDQRMDKQVDMGYENILSGMKSYLDTNNSVICFKTELVSRGGRYSSYRYKYTNITTLMDRNEIEYLDDYFVAHKDDKRQRYHISNCSSYLINKDYKNKKGEPKYIGGSYPIGYTDRTEVRMNKIKDLLDFHYNIYCKKSKPVQAFGDIVGYVHSKEKTTTVSSDMLPVLIKDYDQYFVKTENNETFNIMNCYGKKRKYYNTKDIRSDVIYEGK